MAGEVQRLASRRRIFLEETMQISEEAEVRIDPTIEEVLAGGHYFRILVAARMQLHRARAPGVAFAEFAKVRINCGDARMARASARGSSSLLIERGTLLIESLEDIAV